MDKTGLNYRRATIGIGALSVVLIVLCCALFWEHGLLEIRVKLAGAQTRIFDDVCNKARQGNTENAASCLEYVVNYYPSGTKQQPGSDLDQMVERERIMAEQKILAYLRVKTGQDLGERPEAWIKKYATR